MGYLKIILGPMTSGKTTALIQEYERHSAIGLKCCFVNHENDLKRKQNYIYTHNEKKSENIKNIFHVNNLFDIKNKLNDFDVFLINEGQFFFNLYEGIDFLVNKLNKKVFVGGLDGDFKRKRIGEILDIIPLCDAVIKLKSLCSCNKKAIFTQRLCTDSNEQIIIGGKEIYKPVCRNCYNNNHF